MARTSSVDRACALHERAVALRAAGRPGPACRAAREAAAIFRRVDGPRSPDAANALLELSAGEVQLGHHGRALGSATRAWSILRPLRGGGEDLARLKASALSRLSAVHVARGEYAEARRLQLRAVARAEALGEADLVGALNGLGIVGKFTARWDEASRSYRRALAIGERLYGPRSPRLTALLHNLGGLEHARGRFARGVPFARRGLAIRERAVGKHHPDVAADVAALAALLDGCRRHAEAARLYRRALETYGRVYGKGHFEVGFNLANLAALEQQRGRLAQAERLHARALPILRRALGGAHPFLAQATHNFGLLRHEQGRHGEAERLLVRASKTFRRALGPGHPDARACDESLAAVRAARAC